MGWGSLVRRDLTGEIREEEESRRIFNKGNFHNDKSCGSKNLFEPKTLNIFEKIVEEVEKFYKDNDNNRIGREVGITHENVPEVFLVPYEKWFERRKLGCSSDFAKKMRDKYDKEKKTLEQIRQDNPLECEKAIGKLQKKYGPWICLLDKCSEGCSRIKHTPLGWFDPDEYKIYICLDGIIKLCEKNPEEVDSISALVLFHELGHAIMYNPAHKHYETLFEYWSEEALANDFTLKYLFVASRLLDKPNLYAHAHNFVKKQNDAYFFGLWVFENNALDWQTLRDNKNRISEETGDSWVNAVCEEDRDFFDIQRLFYCTFAGGTKTVRAITPASSKRFCFEEESNIVRSSVYFSTCKIKGPDFYHVYPDCKLNEVDLTFKNKDGEFLFCGQASFYKGTQNLFLKGQLLTYYKDKFGLSKGKRFAFSESKPADGDHFAEWEAIEL